MSSQPSTPSPIDDLEDQIANYEKMLHYQTEKPSSPDPEYQSFLEDHLQGLRTQLQALRPALSPASSARMRPPNIKIEYISRPDSRNSAVSNNSGWSGGWSGGWNGVAPRQNNNSHSSLVSRPDRKRQHDFLEAEFPESKSLRQSPNASPAYTGAPSPAATSDSSDLDDDPVLRRILGTDWEENHRETTEYLNELAERRRREAEDAAFARSLDAGFTNSSIGSGSSKNRPSGSSSSQQTRLNPNGSIYRPMPPPAPPQRSIKVEPQRSPYLAGPSSLPRSPQSLNDDSDSDLEEIPPSAFIPNSRLLPLRGTNYPAQMSLPNLATPTMPGTFPGNNPYSGFGGSSVYNPTSYDLTDSPPGYNPGWQDTYFNGIPMPAGLAASLPGSHATPIDVDNYASRLRDYYGSSDKTEQDIKNLLQHLRPDEELNPEERTETPTQMRIELMPHQKLGLGWMQKMEASTNRGGILADDMGLGKTIQALALIVSRPPPDGARLPTLIVAPVSLLIQWSREAEKVMRPHHYQLKVAALHGATRRTPWHVLKDHDIILTTYGTLASELKRKLAWDEKAKRLEPGARPSVSEQCSILGERSRFHRVILDEAQCIKNKATKAAVAACWIQAGFRWCMTGTPMQNRVEELHSLVKFCRIKPYDNAERFARDFTRPLKYEHSRDKAMRQLQVLCKAILLRRTKTSKIDGKPILQLPPKTTLEARAVFSQDEREFYLALQEQTQIQFNRYMKAGTVGRNYSNVLVLLLRLRQACCHPHLIKDFEINTGGVGDLDLIANARELPKAVVARLREQELPECPICMEGVANPLILSPCGHSVCDECLSRLVDQAATNEEGGPVKCVHCRTKLDTLKTTDHQSFLRVHCPEREGVEPLDDDESEAPGEDDNSDESEDSNDDDDGEDLKDFIVPDDVVEYDSENEAQKYNPGKNPFEKSKKDCTEAKKKKTKSKKGKGKRKEKHAHKSLAQLRKEGLRNKSAKKAYLERLEANWQTSAKIERTLEILTEINARRQGEKTIIFSGFTSFLDLLEVPISRQRELGEYVRYDGSMTSKDRNEAVLSFTDEPNVRMMLVSLKAGNAGLNLTAANNVIILDPHWNPFVEAQCQDRAHRIGQMRPVTVHRVLIDGEGMPLREDGATVEDRILKLQDRKRELVESALDEAAGNSLTRLGTRELGYLFGVNSM